MIYNNKEFNKQKFKKKYKNERNLNMFKLHSDYKPTGDQPQAIEYLSKGIEEGKKFQTLLGVTGSGKTFTMANIINKVHTRKNEIRYKTFMRSIKNEKEQWNGNNKINFNGGFNSSCGYIWCIFCAQEI